MTEVRVHTYALEDMLFHGRAARIKAVRLDDAGYVFFEVEGSAIPEDAGVLVVRTVRIENTTFEPAPA